MARRIYRRDGTYEAGIGNSDWRAQDAGSRLATDRLRNNPLFPYASSQVAMAEDIAQGSPGGAPAMPTYRPAPKSISDVYAEQQKEYRKKLDENNANVLAGYDQRRAELLELAAGQGPKTAQEIALERQRRATEADLRDRNLHSSTIADEARGDLARAAQDLAWDKKLQLNDRLAAYGLDRTKALESAEIVPPNAQQLIDLERQRGMGATTGLTPVASGIPRIAGNPYGMARPRIAIPQGGQRGGPQQPPQQPAAVAEAPPAPAGPPSRFQIYEQMRRDKAARAAKQAAVVGSQAYRDASYNSAAASAARRRPRPGPLAQYELPYPDANLYGYQG
jgi:hypothetical protein